MLPRSVDRSSFGCSLGCSLGSRFARVGVHHTPRRVPRKAPAIASDPLVDAIEQPGHTRDAPHQQRQLRAPRHGDEEPDSSRTARSGIVGDGPCSTFGLGRGQPRSLRDTQRLRGDDVDSAVAIEAVEPTGRPGAEASIPVEDERGRLGDGSGQRAIISRVVQRIVAQVANVHGVNAGCFRRPSPAARTRRRAGRHRSRPTGGSDRRSA